MPDAGTAADRGTDHPVADVRRFPERHQVGGPPPAQARVRRVHFRMGDTRWRYGHFMIVSAFGRYLSQTAHDHESAPGGTVLPAGNQVWDSTGVSIFDDLGAEQERLE